VARSSRSLGRGGSAARRHVSGMLLALLAVLLQGIAPLVQPATARSPAIDDVRTLADLADGLGANGLGADGLVLCHTGTDPTADGAPTDNHPPGNHTLDHCPACTGLTSPPLLLPPQTTALRGPARIGGERLVLARAILRAATRHAGFTARGPPGTV
jgi:hypothetical protein